MHAHSMYLLIPPVWEGWIVKELGGVAQVWWALNLIQEIPLQPEVFYIDYDDDDNKVADWQVGR